MPLVKILAAYQTWREASLFGLAFAPGTVIYISTDFDALTHSPWFVAGRVLLINVVLPAAFAVWRVYRQRGAESRERARAVRRGFALHNLEKLIDRSQLPEEFRLEARAIFISLETPSDEESKEGRRLFRRRPRSQRD